MRWRAAREDLYQLYEEFRRVGAHLESAARQVREGAEPSPPLATINPEFEGWQQGSLNDRPASPRCWASLYATDIEGARSGGMIWCDSRGQASF